MYIYKLEDWPCFTWDTESLASTGLNDRQRLVLNRLVDGFEGNLTSTKYAKLAKCSHDTGMRDIYQLVEKSILVRNPKGGRSTSYVLANFPRAPVE